MTDFRTELRSASFRGISFEIVDDDGAGGRRWVTHEYPGRDEPHHEDLGASVRVISFRCSIVGSGYVARAEALEKALLQGGAGTLIHPHYGEVQVVVKECRRAHAINAIGEVSFNVVAERYSATGGISIVSDTARNLSLASSSMFDFANTDFLGGLAEGLFPGFVTADGISRLGGFISLARDIFRQYGLSGIGNVPDFGGVNAGSGDQIVSLFKGLVTSARPQEIPVVGSAPVVTAANPEPVKLVRALVQVASNDVDSAITASSPSRAAMVQNATAISTLVKASALAAAGGVARYAAYDSREQAIETRDLLSDGLAGLRERQLIAGRMPAFRATTDMAVAVTEDISERLGRLPRTVKVKGNTVRPSLAIANRLYGDDPSIIFGRADDIVKRNGISHPGFVSAKPLEVLLND